MKTMIIVLGLLLSMDVLAMRCGTSLVNEGDSLEKLFSLCGDPDVNTLSNIIYRDKDGDGMTYYIHADSNGIIDSINFSRQ